MSNESEFINAKCIEDLGVSNVYYALAIVLMSMETIKMQIGLLRRFIPKGTDIKKLSDNDIKEIEKFINEYPRAIFGGKTTNEIYAS